MKKIFLAGIILFLFFSLLYITAGSSVWYSEFMGTGNYDSNQDGIVNQSDWATWASNVLSVPYADLAGWATNARSATWSFSNSNSIFSILAGNASMLEGQYGDYYSNRSNHFGFILTNDVANLDDFIGLYTNGLASIIFVTNEDLILSNAIQGDITTATNNINWFLPLAGGTMQGDINLNTNFLTNVGDIYMNSAIYGVDAIQMGAGGGISNFGSLYGNGAFLIANGTQINWGGSTFVANSSSLQHNAIGFNASSSALQHSAIGINHTGSQLQHNGIGLTVTSSLVNLSAGQSITNVNNLYVNGTSYLDKIVIKSNAIFTKVYNGTAPDDLLILGGYDSDSEDAGNIIIKAWQNVATSGRDHGVIGLYSSKGENSGNIILQTGDGGTQVGHIFLKTGTSGSLGNNTGSIYVSPGPDDDVGGGNIYLTPIGTSKTYSSNDIDMTGNKITNLAEPIASNHASTKYYVDLMTDSGWTNNTNESSTTSTNWQTKVQLNFTPMEPGNYEINGYSILSADAKEEEWQLRIVINSNIIVTSLANALIKNVYPDVWVAQPMIGVGVLTNYTTLQIQYRSVDAGATKYIKCASLITRRLK